jgi:hypothetical protein
MQDLISPEFYMGVVEESPSASPLNGYFISFWCGSLTINEPYSTVGTVKKTWHGRKRFRY